MLYSALGGVFDIWSHRWGLGREGLIELLLVTCRLFCKSERVTSRGTLEIGDRGGATGSVTPLPPPRTENMNVLDRFKIFSCSLGRQSVDGLDKMCLKYGTTVILCVFLAYIEATVAR